jgi:hypothetical protein
VKKLSKISQNLHKKYYKVLHICHACYKNRILKINLLYNIIKNYIKISNLFLIIVNLL